MRSLRLSAFYLLLLVLLLPVACVEREEAVGENQAASATVQTSEQLKIADILKAPDKYLGQQVQVAGEAEGGLAFQFVNEQPYLLKDGSGEIWVITTGMVPAAGHRLEVMGEVVAPYQIKGHRYAVVLLVKEEQP